MMYNKLGVPIGYPPAPYEGWTGRYRISGTLVRCYRFLAAYRSRNDCFIRRLGDGKVIPLRRR